MLKYAQVVRTAAARHKGWGWRSYDIEFWLRQEWQPPTSWVTVDGELWSLFVVPSVARPFQMKQNQSGGTLPQQENKGFIFVANSPLPRIKKSARGQYWAPKLKSNSLCMEVVLRFQRSRL